MANILIIDDDNELRASLRVVLEGQGHQVREAVNGVEGLQAYRQQPADLVLCDIFMPEKEGLETVRELRHGFPGVKIISMSGGSAIVSADFLKNAKTFGAARVLYKPFSIAKLLEAVAQVLKE